MPAKIESFEIQIDHARINQLYGVRNTRAPSDVEIALDATLSAAKPVLEKAHNAKPNSDNNRLYGILHDHVI